MKKTLSLLALFSSLLLASAQTTLYSPNVVLYSQDWGSVFAATNGAAATNSTHEGTAANLPEVGWSVINIGTGYSGGYIGVDAATAVGVNMDVINGITTALATRDIYVAEDSADQGQAVMIFTTDTSGAGPGSGAIYTITNASITTNIDPNTGFGVSTNIAVTPQGDSVFTDINPTNYSSLVFTAFTHANNNTGVGVSAAQTLMSNYFAVQISNATSGNVWYVSTTPLANNPVGGAAYSQVSLTYNPATNKWNNLTVVPPSVAIPGGTFTTPGSVTLLGTPPAVPLAGIITGFGIVQYAGPSALTASGTLGVGFNYKLISIITPRTNTIVATAPVFDAPGYSQSIYLGGTANFAVDAKVTGTDPISWTWFYNGAPIVNGANGNATGSTSVISGATTNRLTITGVTAADAGTYSCEVANIDGHDFTTNYNTNLTLTVLPLMSPVSPNFPSGNPNDIVYAENFPYPGPFNTGEGENLISNAIGWSVSAVYPISFANHSVDEAGNVYVYANPGVNANNVNNGNIGWNYLWVQSPTASATQSGLSFPAAGINPANYNNVLSFRASIAQLAAFYQGSATPSATAYFMVEMTGNKWYVNTSAMNMVAGSTTNNIYSQQFSPLASGWLTIGNMDNGPFGNTAAEFFPNAPGPAASADLTGNIIGAGVAFDFGAPGLYTMNNFMIVTDSTPPLPVSFAAPATGLYNQTVYVGGGATFAFTEGGAPPFTNNWELNNSGGIGFTPNLTDGTNADGSIFLGTQTTSLTIENAQPNEAGTYDPIVSNPAGITNFAAYNQTYGDPFLTVNSQPVGLIYYENYPVPAAITGNVAGTNFGWTAQSAPYPAPGFVYYQQAAVGQFPTPNAAGFAYMGSTTAPTNSLFYASTTSDNGYSGLPFTAFDPANYPANTIQFSTTIGQSGATYTNVQGSFAIQQGGQWYVSATPFWPFYTNAPPPVGLNTAINTVETLTYTPTASAWKTVTFVGANGLTIGGTPTANLGGAITAAGLLFQGSTAGTGTLNWITYGIQASGAGNLIGGVNVGGVVNGAVTLTWVGNAAVNLQSANTITSTFADVPNTLGQHSFTVNAAGAQKFYRLVMH